MQKSAQHSSHWYQDIQRMLPRINRNSLGWRIYRAPHLSFGSVQIFPGWDAVVLERSQGMAMCQWEGVPETGGCRDLLWEWPSFPSGGYNPVLVSSKACQDPPCTPYSLGGLHTIPCVIPLVRLVVDADEALSRIRHLWKSILKSCHTVTVRSHEANAQLSKSMSQGNQ